MTGSSVTLLSDSDDLTRMMAGFLLDPASVQDPYPLYRRLREADPVHRSPLGIYVVTAYEGGIAVLRDSTTFGRAEAAEAEWRPLAPDGEPAEVGEAVEAMLLGVTSRDGDDHARIRRLISKPFTPLALERWRSRIGVIAGDLLRACVARRDFDFIADFSAPLPQLVMCDFLGVPADDRALWTKWGRVVAEFSRLSERHDEVSRLAAGGTLAAFCDYFRHLIRSRREEPADDLLSELFAQRDRTGVALEEDELIGTMVMLFRGGHETTANLLANGLLALFTYPDQHEALRADVSLLPNAIEEFLRYDGPGRSNPRSVSEPATLLGTELEPGARILAIEQALNRDPSVFDSPEELDITRDPNPHLGFGFGPHFCVGAHLARLVASTAFETIFDAGVRLELDISPDDLKWRPSWIRALTSLPVTVV